MLFTHWNVVIRTYPPRCLTFIAAA